MFKVERLSWKYHLSVQFFERRYWLKWYNPGLRGWPSSSGTQYSSFSIKCFFWNINRHTHPLIYMKGINSDTLNSLVDFMYHGSVNISEVCLEAILKVASEIAVQFLKRIIMNCIQKRKLHAKTMLQKVKKYHLNINCLLKNLLEKSMLILRNELHKNRLL